MMNFLEPIKKAPKKFKEFGIIDIEAQDWIEFVVAGIYDQRGFEYIDYSEGEKGIYYDNDKRDLAPIHDIFEYIFDQSETEIYFAHFGGGYDFLFLLNYVVRSKEFTFISAIPRGSKILCMRVERNGHKIQIWDSSALLQFSLKELTKSFGVENLKGKIDFNFIRKIYDNVDYSKELKNKKKFITFPNGEYELVEDHEIKKVIKNYEIVRHHVYKREELMAYLKNDCIGLHQVLTKFYNWPHVKKAGQAFTIASQAMKIYRTKMDKPIEGIDGENEEFIRKSYVGGRVEIITPCFKDEKRVLNEYDKNSLYPYVMWKNDFPVKVLGHTSKFKPNELAVYHALVEVPEMFLPPLPYKFDNKLIFPYGTFSGHWTAQELAMAKRYGVKIKKIYDGIRFLNGGKIFATYITEQYDIRVKSARGTVDNILSKTIMNASYGRFGINDDKEIIAWEEHTDDEQDFMEVKIDGKTFMLVKRPQELKGFRNVAIGTYIASYARIEMYPSLASCGKELYYTDTDCLHTTKTMPSGDGLGELKLENADEPSHESIYLLPKTYITSSSIRMKGFDRKCANYGPEDFTNALQGDLSMMKYTVKAAPLKFKSAIKRKGNILAMSDESEKRIKAIYNKREVIKAPDIRDWTTKPLYVNELTKTFPDMKPKKEASR